MHGQAMTATRTVEMAVLLSQPVGRILRSKPILSLRSAEQIQMPQLHTPGCEITPRSQDPCRSRWRRNGIIVVDPIAIGVIRVL